jgi:hypothetical protein
MGRPTVAPRTLSLFEDFDDIATRPRHVAALARLLELALLGFLSDREESGELVDDRELLAYSASSVERVTSIAADAAERPAVA